MRRRRVLLLKWLLLLYNIALQEYLPFEEIADPCRKSCVRVPLRRMDFGHALEPYVSRRGNYLPVLQGRSETDVETDWTSSERKRLMETYVSH